MKKLIATISLLIFFLFSKGQQLLINKYLKDTLVGTGWQIWHDSLHNGVFYQLVGSGGSGSGTVNNGAINRLAYYAATGTVVSNLAAITANRALISNASGLPTHSAVTDLQLSYVGNVTSDIQAQFTGKLSTALSSANIFVGNGSNIATGVAMTGDIGITNLGVASIQSGVIVNADVNASAAIAYSKLNLSNSIVNGDVVNATIVASTKLSATGTPSSTTVLAGDDTWKTALTYSFTSPQTSDLLVLSNSTTAINKNILDLIDAGTNITFSGAGTIASPLVINASGGSSGVADSIPVLSSTPTTGNIWIDSATGILTTRDWVNSYIKHYAAADSSFYGGGVGYLEEQATSGGTITESPSHTFTQATGSPYTVFTPNIGGSEDKELVVDITSSDNIQLAVGLDVNNTNDNYFSGSGLWAYAAYHDGSAFTYIEEGGSPVTGPSVSPASGVLMKLKRAGSTVTAEYSTNSGSSWTVFHTYSVTTSAALYPKAAWPVGGKKLTNALIQ